MKNQFVIQWVYLHKDPYEKLFVFNKWELDFVFDWQNGKWFDGKSTGLLIK